MQSIELNIARRYLFSHKGHSAINITTAISTAVVAVVTAAMVCVLSVMNGFGVLMEQMFSRFDPEIKIVSADGRLFERPDLPADAGIEMVSEVISGQALVEYGDKQIPCILMGVDSLFDDVSDIRSIIREGKYTIYDGAFDRAVLGQGLAARLGVYSTYSRPLHIYVPRRSARVDLLRPDRAFYHTTLFMSGRFAVDQPIYDDRCMLVPVSRARELLEADSTQVSALHVRLRSDASVRRAKDIIAEHLPDSLLVLDRYEQQGDYYRILGMEKWLTVLLMVFILIIACFNLIGSLTMIRLDKQPNAHILAALGMSPRRIRRIHILVGVWIAIIGASIGLALGVGLCLAQQHFGLITLGDGTEYIIAAYPVALRLTDLLLVLVIVLVIGLLSSWIASARNTTPTSD